MDGLVILALIAMSVMTLLNLRVRPPQVIVMTAPPETQRPGCMPWLVLVLLLFMGLVLLSALAR